MGVYHSGEIDHCGTHDIAIHECYVLTRANNKHEEKHYKSFIACQDGYITNPPCGHTEWKCFPLSSSCTLPMDFTFFLSTYIQSQELNYSKSYAVL